MPPPHAGKWISIASTDAPFSSITKAVRLAGTLGQLKPSGKLTRTATTIKASQSVIGVHGGLPGGAQSGVTGSAVLYVATAQPTVPVVFQVTESSGGTKESDVGTFTKWGQPLHLVAPTNAVAYASVPAS